MSAENLEMGSLKTLCVGYALEIVSPGDVSLNPKAPGHGGVCRGPLMGAFLESNSLQLQLPVSISVCKLGTPTLYPMGNL